MATTRSRQRRREHLQPIAIQQVIECLDIVWPDLSEHDVAFEQAKRELPVGTVRDWLKRAEEIRNAKVSTDL